MKHLHAFLSVKDDVDVQGRDVKELTFSIFEATGHIDGAESVLSHMKAGDQLEQFKLRVELMKGHFQSVLTMAGLRLDIRRRDWLLAQAYYGLGQDDRAADSLVHAMSSDPEECDFYVAALMQLETEGVRPVLTKDAQFTLAHMDESKIRRIKRRSALAPWTYVCIFRD